MTSSLAGKSAGMGLVQFVGSVAAVGLNALLARSLTREEFGEYQLVLSWLAISHIICIPGFSQSNLKGASQGNDRILSLTVQSSRYGSLVGTTGFLAVGLWLMLVQQNARTGLLLLIAAPYFFSFSYGLFDSFLMGKQQYFQSRQLYLAHQIGRLLLLGSAALLSREVIVVLAADVVTQLTYTMIGYRVASRYKVERSRTPEAEGALIRLGWKMTVAALATTVGSRIERVILGAMDPRLLALYHIGELVPRRVKDQGKPLLVVPITQWARMERVYHVEGIKKHWWIFGGLGILAFGVLFFASEYLITLVFSAEYAEAVWITRMLSFSLIFTFLEMMMLSVAIYQGAEDLFQRIQSGSAVLRIVLILALLPLFSIAGVVAATLTVDLLRFVVVSRWFFGIDRKSNQDKADMAP
jgi:O-antigen/teichoic acid export membrane protein